MEATTEEGRRQLQALRKEEEEFTSFLRSCLLGMCAHDLHQNPSTTASNSKNKACYQQQKEQLKAQTEGIFVLDYKETLRLGQSLDEETRIFYKQPRRAV
ncbi:hypothetical protein QOT17_007366 [Balamuthia mandrillaris]